MRGGGRHRYYFLAPTVCHALSLGLHSAELLFEGRSLIWLLFLASVVCLQAAAVLLYLEQWLSGIWPPQTHLA